MENNNKSEVKKFCEEHRITEDQFYGRKKIEGFLNLGYVTKLPKGFNPTVGGDLWLGSVKTLPTCFNPTVGCGLDLNSVEELPVGFNPTVGGYLNLSSVKELPAGFNPTVGGYLDLHSVKELPEGFNPTVGGYLNLYSVETLPAGFNPTVGRYLYLNSVEELPDGFNPTVGGSIYLNSVKSIHSGFNPIVGGSIDLSSVKSIHADFNPTVGGYLWLSSVEELPNGFNPTVGGNLYTKDSSKRINNLPQNFIFSWQNGRYIKVDGIFTEVIKHRCNVYHTRCIGKDDILYLVTDGNGTWAHGSTLSEAKEDLIYKSCDRNKDSYKDLTLDSELSFSEAVTCYRVITGACAAGVREFVARKLTNSKKDSSKYTIKGIIDITVGEYGHDAFEGFFRKK